MGSNRQTTQKNLSGRLKLLNRIARSEKAKSDALITNLGEGVIATDSKGKIMQVNQAALDVLHFKKSELIGQWFPGKVVAYYEDGKVIDNLERPANKVFITGGVINENLLYKSKGGEMVPVAVTVSPIFLRGKPVGIVEIFRDRSSEIETDRLKQEFISIASHQLRTPLSSVYLYAHMLKDGYSGELTGQQKELLKIILSAASRMNKLINTMLNITRVEGNSMSVESKPSDVKKLVERIIKEFVPKITKKNIDLNFEADGQVPIISTDKVILGEIINNLLSNSVKYTQPGGKISITLSIEGRFLVFGITDNGAGIPSDSQKFIFNKFFRANNVLKMDVDGTGLGLYLTKLLTAKINSDIHFSSEEGNGSSFYVELPISGSISFDGKFGLEKTI